MLALAAGQTVQVVPIDMVMATAMQPTGDKLLPGATALPSAIGSKLTIRNALIGGAIVAAAGALYLWFSPPKKKAVATTSTASKPISGLFNFGRRRRRRRR